MALNGSEHASTKQQGLQARFNQTAGASVLTTTAQTCSSRQDSVGQGALGMVGRNAVEALT